MSESQAVLHSLPPGWEWVALEELALHPTSDIVDGPFGSNLKASEYQRDGVPIIRLQNVDRNQFIEKNIRFITTQKASELKRHGFVPGDVVITKLGDPLGEACIVPDSIGPGVVVADVVRARLDERFLSKRYLVHAINSGVVAGQLKRTTKGTTRPRVNLTHIRQLRIPFAPLSEQTAIVDEIEKLFTQLDVAVAALKRVRANLKRYRTSVLKAACEGRLVPREAELARVEGRDYETGAQLLARILKERRAKWESDQLANKMHATGKPPKDDKWKARYEEPAAPDTSNLPPVPDGWTWATLPQVGELNRGKSKHRPRDDPKLYGGPYPFIQTGEVKRSGGTIRAHSQTYNEFGLAQSRLWPAGTLCITIAANIAETGILTYDACFPDSVVGLLFDGPAVTVRFIELFIRTARDQLERFAPATAQKNINLETLSDVGIPLPPFAEQERIVSEVERLLSAADAAGDVVNAGLRRSERLRQAILRRAFEGKLVPQDPNDEPAGALLERIGAERAKLDQAAKPAKGGMRRPSQRSAKTEIFAWGDNFE